VDIIHVRFIVVVIRMAVIRSMAVTTMVMVHMVEFDTDATVTVTPRLLHDIHIGIDIGIGIHIDIHTIAAAIAIAVDVASTEKDAATERRGFAFDGF
jgi:hypothetical protein